MNYKKLLLLVACIVGAGARAMEKPTNEFVFKLPSSAQPRSSVDEVKGLFAAICDGKEITFKNDLGETGWVIGKKQREIFSVLQKNGFKEPVSLDHSSVSQKKNYIWTNTRGNSYVWLLSLAENIDIGLYLSTNIGETTGIKTRLFYIVILKENGMPQFLEENIISAEDFYNTHFSACKPPTNRFSIFKGLSPLRTLLLAGLSLGTFTALYYSKPTLFSRIAQTWQSWRMARGAQ